MRYRQTHNRNVPETSFTGIGVGQRHQHTDTQPKSSEYATLPKDKTAYRVTYRAEAEKKKIKRRENGDKEEGKKEREEEGRDRGGK